MDNQFQYCQNKESKAIKRLQPACAMYYAKRVFLAYAQPRQTKHMVYEDALPTPQTFTGLSKPIIVC